MDIIIVPTGVSASPTPGLIRVTCQANGNDGGDQIGFDTDVSAAALATVQATAIVASAVSQFAALSRPVGLLDKKTCCWATVI